jgi:hypothetical protein
MSTASSGLEHPTAGTVATGGTGIQARRPRGPPGGTGHASCCTKSA